MTSSIQDWRYDDGKPTYMNVIDTWTEARRPCWRCKINNVLEIQRIEEWLHDFIVGDWDVTVRFDSGSPHVAIEIYDENDATAFLLRWL